MASDGATSERAVLNYSNFKAWWDVMLDYMVTAAGIIILLVFSRIASYETGMLICTHPGDGESYGYSESRYINSRCCRESNAWALIFYPYVMFFTWMIITTIHLTWLKIPSILSKMEGFADILNGIFSTTPVNYRDPNKPFQITNEFVYDDVNSKKIDRLLNRLQYLLTDKPYLRRSYVLKHLLVMIFCLLSLFFTLAMMSSWARYDLSFACTMSEDLPVKRAYPVGEKYANMSTICHLNSGFFILFTVHFDALVRLIMILLSGTAMGWIYKDSLLSCVPKRFQCRKALKRVSTHAATRNDTEMNKFGGGDFDSWEAPLDNNDNRIFGEAESYLSGLPSYDDLTFWLQLLRLNSHDGNLMYNSIRSCIRTYFKQFQDTSQHGGTSRRNNMPKHHHRLVNYDINQSVRTNAGADGADVPQYIVNPKNKVAQESLKLLQDSVYYLNPLCEMLGFNIVPNDMGPNHLFECLEVIRDSLGSVVFRVGDEMRTEIADEIEKHPDVYKTIIDQDLHFPEYESYCAKLRNKTSYGSHYALLAAATILRVRIVVVHFANVDVHPEVYNPVRQTVIMSQRKGNNYQCGVKLNNETSSLPVKFVTFIEPHFYNNTEDREVDADWPHIVLGRTKFANNIRFRNEQKRTIIRTLGEITSIETFCRDVLHVPNASPFLFK